MLRPGSAYAMAACIQTEGKGKKQNIIHQEPFYSSLRVGKLILKQGLFIKDLGANHRLLFNKYNIHQEHLLVVTKEFEPQSSKLTREDFKQTIVTFRAVRGLFFFNSGPKAGASQLHKHIQVKNLLNTGKNIMNVGKSHLS